MLIKLLRKFCFFYFIVSVKTTYREGLYSFLILLSRYFSDELSTSQKSTLTKYGCKCNSSVIKLSSTDPITLSKIPHLVKDFGSINVPVILEKQTIYKTKVKSMFLVHLKCVHIYNRIFRSLMILLIFVLSKKVGLHWDK